MVKRTINLYADHESITLAMSKGINLSQFFDKMLKLELQTGETQNKESIELLKITNLRLTDQLQEKMKEITFLKSKIEELNNIKVENDKRSHRRSLYQ